MIVIVPHRDLELKLIKSQKEIIRQLAEKEADKIFYASIPLWIKTDFESVEQAKKQIKSVTVLEPQYDDEGIFCPVEIESVSGDVFESKLDFIRHCEERSDVAIQTYDETFPLPVKIFRLGECTNPKPGLYELASTVWKKTTS